MIRCAPCGKQVVRWLPLFIVDHDQVDQAVDTFRKALDATKPRPSTSGPNWTATISSDNVGVALKPIICRLETCAYETHMKNALFSFRPRVDSMEGYA